MTELKFNQNKNVCQANRKSTRIQIIFSQIVFLHIKFVVRINISRLFQNAGHHLLFSWSPSSFTQAFWVYVVLCSIGKTWNISKSQLSRHSRLISLYLRAAEPQFMFVLLHIVLHMYKYILLTTRSPSFCAFNTRQAILVCFHSNSSLSHGIEA